MFELIKDFLLKALGLVVPFVVRWFYKRGKFTNCIKVRVRGEGDGITFNCGELPSVRLWLVLTNFTPFEIEFERIYGQIVYGSAIGEFLHLRRYVLPSAQEKEILVEFWLNESQVKYLRQNQGKNEARLYFGTYITSSIYCLELAKEIGTNNVRFLNCAL